VELVVSLLVPGVVFGGFRKVLGQFSFASDWTLQAKAALRVIKEEDLGPLSQARVPAAKVQDGQRLVGIDACVKACMGLIEKYINRGKTTFLQELGGKLAGAQYFPIFVSFNGESPVKRRDNELAEAERRASRFMKDVFLDADGAYMVFTSHIQSTGLDLTQYME
ncbi:unnamed protein product, partial [Symbiodinium microadriaticum]